MRQRDLVSSTEGGRGFFISNDSKERTSEFNKVVIEGTGPPGWEIELYNNNNLIDFGAVQDNGFYIFEDISINFGRNEIKILFFGPQGEVREEVRTYMPGGNMLSPNEFKYNFGIVDSNEGLFEFEDNDFDPENGYTKTGVVSYGLSEDVTVFATYSDLPDEEGSSLYVSAGSVFCIDHQIKNLLRVLYYI